MRSIYKRLITCYKFDWIKTKERFLLFLNLLFCFTFFFCFSLPHTQTYIFYLVEIVVKTGKQIELLLY